MVIRMIKGALQNLLIYSGIRNLRDDEDRLRIQEISDDGNSKCKCLSARPRAIGGVFLTAFRSGRILANVINAVDKVNDGD